MPAGWTPEREDLARRLFGEGESASVIARQLGGVSRNSVVGKLHRMGLSRYSAPVVPAQTQPKPKRKARAKAVCAVPGCGEPLNTKNAMGVCLAHKHAAGLCRCPACQGQPVARRADPIPRDHVRSVTVPRAGTSTSGEVATVRVSLPREPWLPGAA